ncbi:MAG: thioredoxin domain-containing protein [Bacteriovoracaceae bacterium]|nr:thioredoxin domain-containing protein [Bacteriovoracaceae bacterium]
MNYLSFALLAGLMFISSCIGDRKMVNENRLKYEKSPYLLQHKDNPIWWHSWGDAAFEQAKKQNKLIFLSIGYSTCHWCHVMEKESFENSEVAQLLNQHFVAIKVDREERPDVDKLYMNSANMLSIRGGWPLSMFLTPDKVPFFGGTYFPKQTFITTLVELNKRWVQDPKQIYKVSEEIKKILKKTQKPVVSKTLNGSAIEKIHDYLTTSFDETYGGFGAAPKFPAPMLLKLLIRLIHTETDKVRKKVSLDMLNKTLEGMFQGGIYDHIGGGFARYSTDAKWLVPHFEKMLYDNALLAVVYFEAYKLTDNSVFKNIAEDILDYILKDMTSKDGGFYSAEDADSEGVEGKFYVWTVDELKKLLTEMEYDAIKDIYGFTKEGNFEHNTNIFNIIASKALYTVFTSTHNQIKEKLYKLRKKRTAPHLDDKILTSWNGLMISAFSIGYQITGKKVYYTAAYNALNFVKEKLDKENVLKRRYRAGESRYNAYLDDYAYLIEGLLNFYEATFDEKIFAWILDLQSRQDKNLWGSEVGLYYFNQVDHSLLQRNFELFDSARPNSNALSALNLQKLYLLTYNEKFLKKANSIMKTAIPLAQQYPSALSQALIALHFNLNAPKQIAIVGDPLNLLTKGFLEIVHKRFYPNKVLALSQDGTKSSIALLKDKMILDGKSTAYVCRNKVCLKPVNDLLEFRLQLRVDDI